jgi:hypothetical protein
MANFLRGHVAAFAAFDAVPRVVLYDYVSRHIIGVLCPSPLCFSWTERRGRSRAGHVAQGT